MGVFTFRPIPPRWDPRWVQETMLNLQNALMILGVENFPNALDGDTILGETTTPLAEKMLGTELQVGVAVALAVPYTTTSLTLVDIGRIIRFDPAVWPLTAAQLYLDVTAGPDGVATCTVELHDGAGAVASIGISSGLSWNRSAFSRVPTTVQSLQLKIKTSDGGVAAQILGAAIVARK